MKPIKNSAEFLDETGLLFEINTKVLHKYGLSLEAVGVTAPPLVVENEEMRSILVVRDQRAAEGGVLHKPAEWVDGARRLLTYVKDEGATKMRERLELVGLLVQDAPVPDKLARPFALPKTK